MAKLKDNAVKEKVVFTEDDRKWMRKSVMKFKDNGRENYGCRLSLYEMFLISVGAVNYYPVEEKITVTSYSDSHIDSYFDKFVSQNHPMLAETFAELSRPTLKDEDGRVYRWISGRFVPRAFWDAMNKKIDYDK